MTSVPPTQPPAAPETDVRLTEAERDMLLVSAGKFDGDPSIPGLLMAVERIVAERVRVVEGERDAAQVVLGQIGEHPPSAEDVEALTSEIVMFAQSRAHYRQRELAEHLAKYFTQRSGVDHLRAELSDARERAGRYAKEANHEEFRAIKAEARAESAEAAQRALEAAVHALADRLDRQHADSDCVCRDYDDPSIWCDNPARALLAGGDR